MHGIPTLIHEPLRLEEIKARRDQADISMTSAATDTPRPSAIAATSPIRLTRSGPSFTRLAHELEPSSGFEPETYGLRRGWGGAGNASNRLVGGRRGPIWGRSAAELADAILEVIERGGRHA
jgi:hypothetical protein